MNRFPNTRKMTSVPYKSQIAIYRRSIFKPSGLRSDHKLSNITLENNIADPSHKESAIQNICLLSDLKRNSNSAAIGPWLAKNISCANKP